VDTLKLKGLKVVKSFYSSQQPNVAHARFEIQNLGSETVSLIIRKVRCRSKGRLIKVPEFFLYNLPDYQEYENRQIDQEPMTTSQYEVSFSPVSAVEFSHNTIFVEIEFLADGQSILLDCPYILALRSEKYFK
jgi:hypothetical protein